jgi:branched-chain amino acid transport system ATP-binding protein
MSFLETKGLCRYFGGLRAVDCVDMKVEKEEIFGIIGPNGAGKTTFFNVCSGTYTATSGEVWFDGKNIVNKKPEEVAHIGLARTFQNLKLFSYMTIAENIAVGFHIRTKTNVIDAIIHGKRYQEDERFIKEKTSEILERLQLTDVRNEMAGNLSYGMQRKVEIARTMALEPKILMLDEPAAGMNPNETTALMDFVRKLNAQGYTILVIEHDMKFMMNLCDRIMVMNYGKKICEGLPEDIKNNTEVQEAYLGKGLQFAEKPTEGGTFFNA